METKTCPGCRQTKPVEEFTWKDKSQGRRQVRCRACTQEQVRNHYRANRKLYISKARLRNRALKRSNQRLVLAYLALHPCVDCRETDVICLQFDHVRGRKVQSISSMLGTYRWEIIEAEIV
jgi:hypothetical protein